MKKRNLGKQIVLMTAMAIVMSVTLTTSALWLFYSDAMNAPTGDGTSPWTMAIVIAIIAPLCIAPVVVWRNLSLLDALDEARAQLALAAATDQLTGLFNRRGFEEAAGKMIEEARVKGEAVAILLCDIDHFKSVNDNFGHEFGDQSIKHVAQILQDAGKLHGGVAGRHGGEEFALLLPSASHGTAKLIAEELRLKCSAVPVAWKDQSTRITVSVGVAVSRTLQNDLVNLLGKADVALYEAKRGGRNKVVADQVEGVAA